jgi:MFS family permease
MIEMPQMLEPLLGPKDSEPAGRIPESQRRLMINTGMTVLLMQWLLIGLIPAFFPNSKYAENISSLGQGMIFASFPLGSSIMSPFVERVTTRLGKKATVLSGLFCMANFMSLFGLVPMLVSLVGAEGNGTVYHVAFVVTGLCYGMGSSLAEAGVYALLAAAFPEDMGSISAKCESAIGVGSLLGPFIGGAVYDAAARFTAPWQFAMPFLAVLPLTLGCYVVFAKLFPEPDDSGEGDGTEEGEVQLQLSDIVTFPVKLLLLSVVVNSALYSSMDPTLAKRLSYPPVRVRLMSSKSHNTDYACRWLHPLQVKDSATTVGLMFLLSAGTYMGSALVVGNVLDKHVKTRAIMNKIMGVGCIVTGFMFVIVGPFNIDGFWQAEEMFNNQASVALAMVVWGVGMGFSIVPSLPAVLIGIPEAQEAARSKLTGLWMFSLGLGYTIGPLTSSSMMGMHFSGLCSEAVCAVEMQQPECLADDTCVCHCFEGYATLGACAYWALGLLLLTSGTFQCCHGD